MKFGPRANSLTEQWHPQRCEKGAEHDEDVPVMPSPIFNKRKIEIEAQKGAEPD